MSAAKEPYAFKVARRDNQRRRGGEWEIPPTTQKNDSLVVVPSSPLDLSTGAREKLHAAVVLILLEYTLILAALSK